MKTNSYKTKHFKSVLAGFLFTVSLANTAQAQFPENIHIGFVYPISTHGTHAPLDTNIFSLHAIGGVSAAERGLAISGITTVVKHDIIGVAIAGFSNHIGDKSQGFLIAGFANTYRDAIGFQLAGFSNVAKRDVEGAQFAGFLNKSRDMNGAQFAGFSNIARNVKGSQFAGFMNMGRALTGSQFAGFSNLASNNINGSQFAGFINTAADVKGSQFAGFINIAKKVKGAQFAGFINIADSSDHPIGIINIIKQGEKAIGVNTDETQTTLLSFRSGGKSLYGIIGLGYNFKNENEVYAFEAGLGAHFFTSKYFRINTEIAALNLESFHRGEYLKSSLRVLPAVKLGSHFEIYGGPVFNYVNTNTTEGKSLSYHYINSWNNNRRNNFQAIYVGYMGGVHLLF